MNTRDTHSAEEQLAAYVLGALDADEVMAVEAHLAHSHAARAEVQALREVVALLPYAAQPVEPPAAVRRQLFARIEANRVAEPTSRPAPVRAARRGARMMMPAIMAALLLLVVGLSALTFSLQMSIAELSRTNQASVTELARTKQSLESSLAQVQQTLDETQANQQALTARIEASQRALEASQRDMAALQSQLSQEQYVLTFISAPGVATRQLEATSGSVDAQGEMYMYPGHSEAIVLFRGLAPLEPGKVYQFWLANSDGQVAAGTVVADADGLARLLVQAPREVNAFTEVMLTIEPAGGSAIPSNQVVLEGSL